MSRIRSIRLRGTRWKIAVINGRLKGEGWRRGTCTRTRTGAESSSKSDNSVRRTLAWPAWSDSTRYAYCMVIPLVYLLQYLFAIVITRFYSARHHPSLAPDRCSSPTSVSRRSWPAPVVRFRYMKEVTCPHLASWTCEAHSFAGRRNDLPLGECD